MKQQSDKATKLHFKDSVPSKIQVVAVTWNLFGSVPPTNSLVNLLNSNTFKSSPDIILIGTQECNRSLTMTLFCQDKQQWENMLKECLPDYLMKDIQNLRGLHSVVFVKKQHENNYESITKSVLKAGVCSMMGNKGAISIQFILHGQPFQFINCHLAAHQNQCDNRNATIERIMGSMVRKDLRTQVVFLGDLNYRIEMTKDQYKKMIQGRKNMESYIQYTKMLPKQQLRNQVTLKDNFLVKFEEGEIKFPPTYKMSIQNNEYNHERIPGWTDRIFHRKGRMQRECYVCEYDIFGCDHRPVLAKFIKTVEDAESQYMDGFVAVKSRGNNCCII